jgi:8-oxo-dGTP pyrophosphatase MutT (NUDIX family)
MAGSVVLDPEGRFLIQRRDDKPTISYPGRLALFGGLREGNETFRECAVREFTEELSYALPAERFEHFMSYDGPDLDFPKYMARAELFVVRDVSAESVTVTEGSLLTHGETSCLRCYLYSPRSHCTS